MTMEWQDQLRPGIALKGLVKEATDALISMDAERLAELARCCADLNRELQESGETAEAAMELRSAAGDVKLLGRVLFETRANLVVLTRLHLLRLQGGKLLEFAPQGCVSEGGGMKNRWKFIEGPCEYGDN